MVYNKSQYKTNAALVITIFLYAGDTWALTAELQRRIQSLEFRCFRNIGYLAYPTKTESLTNMCGNTHKAYKTVRRSPGICKAAKTKMVWARDKIGRPNQSDTKSYMEQSWIGNIAEWTGKSFAERVGRADEEVRHDAPLRLLEVLRDQGKAKKVM